MKPGTYSFTDRKMRLMPSTFRAVAELQRTAKVRTVAGNLVGQYGKW